MAFYFLLMNWKFWLIRAGIKAQWKNVIKDTGLLNSFFFSLSPLSFTFPCKLPMPCWGNEEWQSCCQSLKLSWYRQQFSYLSVLRFVLSGSPAESIGKEHLLTYYGLNIQVNGKWVANSAGHVTQCALKHDPLQAISCGKWKVSHGSDLMPKTELFTNRFLPLKRVQALAGEWGWG